MPTASDRAGFLFFVTLTMSKRAFSTPTAAAVLQNGRWSAAEVATLLDVPVSLVERWAQTGLVPGCSVVAGQWMLPGRSLFLFLGRRIEPHYSVQTVATLLDRPVETVRGWLRLGRLSSVKLGLARQSACPVPESAVIKLLRAEGGAA